MTGLVTSEVYSQDDIDMSDVGPSTAPSRGSGPTWFHDD